MFEAITITQPPSLSSLDIGSCSSAISFPEDCLPASLKSLNIENCRKLEFVKQQQQHKLLEQLNINSSCDSLTSLPLESFPNLRSLMIQYCENLECLSLRDTALDNLTHLKILGCPNFISFPREGFSMPNMTHFVVSNCNKLQSLPCHMNTLFPKLKYMEICNCPEIESFPCMPSSLIEIEICDCEKLIRSPSLALMDMLKSLTIRGPCNSVKSFPETETLLPPSLTSLQLFSLNSLETLDCKGLLHLSSLYKLKISFCNKLVNMVGERLPGSLTAVETSECPALVRRNLC